MAFGIANGTIVKIDKAGRVVLPEANEPKCHPTALHGPQGERSASCI